MSDSHSPAAEPDALSSEWLANDEAFVGLLDRPAFPPLEDEPCAWEDDDDEDEDEDFLDDEEDLDLGDEDDEDFFEDDEDEDEDDLLEDDDE